MHNVNALQLFANVAGQFGPSWNLLKLLPHQNYVRFFSFDIRAERSDSIRIMMLFLAERPVLNRALYRRKTSITELTFYMVWQMHISVHEPVKWIRSECVCHDDSIFKAAIDESNTTLRNKNINAQLVYNIWRLQSWFAQFYKYMHLILWCCYGFDGVYRQHFGLYERKSVIKLSSHFVQ